MAKYASIKDKIKQKTGYSIGQIAETYKSILQNELDNNFRRKTEAKKLTADRLRIAYSQDFEFKKTDAFKLIDKAVRADFFRDSIKERVLNVKKESREIAERYTHNTSVSQLAKEYGVSKTTIYREIKEAREKAIGEVNAIDERAVHKTLKVLYKEPEDLEKTVQETIDQEENNSASNQQTSPLSGWSWQGFKRVAYSTAAGILLMISSCDEKANLSNKGEKPEEGRPAAVAVEKKPSELQLEGDKLIVRKREYEQKDDKKQDDKSGEPPEEPKYNAKIGKDGKIEITAGGKKVPSEDLETKVVEAKSATEKTPAYPVTQTQKPSEQPTEPAVIPKPEPATKTIDTTITEANPATDTKQTYSATQTPVIPNGEKGIIREAGGDGKVKKLLKKAKQAVTAANESINQQYQSMNELILKAKGFLKFLTPDQHVQYTEPEKQEDSIFPPFDDPEAYEAQKKQREQSEEPRLVPGRNIESVVLDPEDGIVEATAGQSYKFDAKNFFTTEEIEKAKRVFWDINGDGSVDFVRNEDNTMETVWMESSHLGNPYNLNVALIDADGNIISQKQVKFKVGNRTIPGQFEQYLKDENENRGHMDKTKTREKNIDAALNRIGGDLTDGAYQRRIDPVLKIPEVYFDENGNFDRGVGEKGPGVGSGIERLGNIVNAVGDLGNIVTLGNLNKKDKDPIASFFYRLNETGRGLDEVFQGLGLTIKDGFVVLNNGIAVPCDEFFGLFGEDAKEISYFGTNATQTLVNIVVNSLAMQKTGSQVLNPKLDKAWQEILEERYGPAFVRLLPIIGYALTGDRAVLPNAENSQEIFTYFSENLAKTLDQLTEEDWRLINANNGHIPSFIRGILYKQAGIGFTDYGSEKKHKFKSFTEEEWKYMPFTEIVDTPLGRFIRIATTLGTNSMFLRISGGGGGNGITGAGGSGSGVGGAGGGSGGGGPGGGGP